MNDIKPLQRSKAFRYPSGNLAKRTCTVGELLEYLAQFPTDMPVLGTWEGVYNGLSHPEVERDFDYGFKEDAADVLVFDVE